MMNLRSFKKRPGSALVITLLIISVISTVSFAITTLALSEFRKSSNLQDSIAAYYAAEAGIEHGLMQQRLWRDSEISQEVYASVHQSGAFLESQIPTKDTAKGRPQAFRLDGGVNSPGFIPSDSTDKGLAWYGLKMWYRGEGLGIIQNGEPVITDQSPRILRDSALQVDIKGATRIVFRWEADPETRRTRPSTESRFEESYFIEAILGASQGVTSTAGQCADTRWVLMANDVNIPVPQNCGFDTVRIKPWNMSYARYGTVLRNGSQNITFDNHVNSVQSTGYTGKAKRTLQVNVSRSTGTILESEDFLLLSGSEAISF